VRSAVKILATFSLALLFTGQPKALAQSIPPSLQYLSYEEFRSVAVGLSHKVNLFRDTWKSSPQAEFFGGTTRDFLYWVKGQFSGLESRKAVLDRIEILRKLSMIDIRDFIVNESDVDVVNGVALNPKNYGVKKIDGISAQRFDPQSPAGQDEINQGFIPVEKIRLSRNGFVNNGVFGDGVREVYEGRPTVHFESPEKFESTHYARLKLNHPLLLALRYVRLLAMNYYYHFGKGYPDEKILFDVDPSSWRTVENVVAQTIASPDFPKYLGKGKFVDWMNQTVQKAFRAYTNPTAAFMLYTKLGLPAIIAKSSKIEPINQYLFAKYRDPSKVTENIRKFNVDMDRFYRPTSEEFSNGKLYHGTGTEKAFSNILLQGILPSGTGAAGKGLYGVAEKNLEVAVRWGGAKDRVVQFSVKPEAKIVDITQGEGKRIWNKSIFKQFNGDIEAFAEAFGIDILKYPFRPNGFSKIGAYVVKNSQVLSRPKGVTRTVLTFSKALELADRISSPQELRRLMESLELCNFLFSEKVTIYRKIRFLNIDQLAESISIPQSPAQLSVQSMQAVAEMLILSISYQDAAGQELEKGKKLILKRMGDIVVWRDWNASNDQHLEATRELGQFMAAFIPSEHRDFIHQRLRDYSKEFRLFSDKRLSPDGEIQTAAVIFSVFSGMWWFLYLVEPHLSIFIPIAVTPVALVPVFADATTGGMERFKNYLFSQKLAKELLKSFEEASQKHRTKCDVALDFLTQKILF